MSFRRARSPEAPKITSVNGSLARIRSTPGSMACGRTGETEAVSRLPVSLGVMDEAPSNRKTLTRICGGIQDGSGTAECREHDDRGDQHHRSGGPTERGEHRWCDEA